MRLTGLSSSELLSQLSVRQASEPDVHSARLFGLVYPSGRADLEELLVEVNRRYLFGNALNPFRFPEVAAMEAEVVDSVATLLHRCEGTGRGGAMTSGGTESILMSMLVHRERARARGVRRPTIVAPISAHPAYAKAAHYFDMDLLAVPLDEQFCANVDAARELIDERTAVVVASAFNYPYGVMDPVVELAAMAASAEVGCHVDACIGGFVLPFLERIGRPVPLFDFRVPGVTTISVDIHKYGYVPKGASVLLHRDDDWAQFQYFLYDKWGAGVYGSPAIAGAKPAAPIACSWTAINFLGVAGYSTIMASLMATVDQLRRAVSDLDGVELVGDPLGPVIALRSSTVDLFAVGAAMEKKGWFLNRNTDPRGLHLMLSPAHGLVIDQLIVDLIQSVDEPTTGSSEVARYS